MSREDGKTSEVVTRTLYELDSRVLAPFYANEATGGKIIMAGDSTIEQLHGLGLVLYTGAQTAVIRQYAPELYARGVSVINRGASGQTMANFLTTGASNSGGYACSLASVITLITGEVSPIVCICYGINDMRGNATIAGTSYGAAAQVTAAQALQAQYVTAAQALYAANPSVRIVLCMPNAHTPTSTYFSNSVTGQNCMDVYRLAWRGDSTYSVSPMDTVINAAVGISISIVHDTLRHVFHDSSFAFSTTVDADGLHPSGTGHYRILYSRLRIFRGKPYAKLTSYQDATEAQWKEQVVALSAIRPRDRRMITESGEFTPVANISFSNGGSTFADIAFHSTAIAQVAYGAALSGTYGATARPGFGAGDVMIFQNASNSAWVVIPVTNPPNANQGNGVLRWANTVPDSVYSNGTLAAGDLGSIWRHKHATSDNAVLAAEQAEISSVAALSNKTAYHVFIKNGQFASITVQEVGTASGHTITTSDLITFSGGDDTLEGLPLTGATITNGSNPGETVITLNSNNWSRALSGGAKILFAP